MKIGWIQAKHKQGLARVQFKSRKASLNTRPSSNWFSSKPPLKEKRHKHKKMNQKKKKR